MQDGDYIVIVLALEILVASEKCIERKPLNALGEKRGGFDLRIDGLGKVLCERQAEDEGAEVIDGSHAANIMREDGFRVEFHVLASLLGGDGNGLARSVNTCSGDATVEHAKVVEVEK